MHLGVGRADQRAGQLLDSYCRDGYRFAADHRLRLVLTSDDQDPDFPAMMTFRHASVGTSSLHRIAASSRLLLPIAAGTP